MDKELKLRLLYLAKIIYDCTDENHFLTTSQLIKKLETDYGISSHRTTIAADIAVLKQFGMDIQITKSSQNQYNLVSREFDDAELKTLIDAVETARFISKSKSKILADKLARLAGKNKAADFRRNVSVERRIKTDNEMIFIVSDTVNEAINKRRKIAFYYFEYTVNKEKRLRHGDYKYVVSPYKLVWNGEFYYLVGYCEKHNAVSSFRIDRIASQPEILEESAFPLPENFDLDKHLNTMFHMFSAKREIVTLRCDNSAIGSVLDKFGISTQILNKTEATFDINVEVAITNIFFCWVFGFGGKVKIKSPENVKEKFKNMLEAVTSSL